MSQMIDPQHECPGVAIPELRLNGEILWTIGVGLPVIFKALKKVVPELVWFSRIEGEYQDNIRIIATANTIAESIPIRGTVSKFVEGEIAEYELTDSIAEKLGVDLEKLEVLSSAQTPVWLITSHDEHWTSLRPLTDNLLPDIIAGVLEQISFSLKRSICWEQTVADSLARIVRANEGVHVQLDARQKDARQKDARQKSPADAGTVQIYLEVRPENRTIKEKLAALNPLQIKTLRRIGCLELDSGTVSEGTGL